MTTALPRGSGPRLAALLALLPCAALSAQVPAPADTTPTPPPAAAAKPKKQFFYFGMHPDLFAQYDPETDQVVRKVKFKNGMAWDSTLSHDKQRFFVVTGQQHKIEVIDRASMEVVSEHDFVEQGYILRIRDVRELPGGTHWYVRVERIKQQIDRYSFDPSQQLLYNVAEKKVEKRLRRLPEVIDRMAQISPDGTMWHALADDGDIAVIDPKTMKEVGRIDLHTPQAGGMGPMRTMAQDLFDGQNPDAYRMLYTMQDPVQKNRSMWGLVDIDLKSNKVAKVEEWGVSPGIGFGLRIAANKKVAAAMGGNFGGGGGGANADRRTRLSLYDLTNGRKLKEAYEEFRPRRGLVAIAPDGSKIYIGIAGSDFEVFDSELKRMKTVELDNEIAGQIQVLDG